ncbi:hypothetical protein ABY64_01620 [Enterobacter hormaechei]|nr:hypothetical protein ABY62_09005 [Enterobacter hormaechei]AKK94127.1 hypothetical protein ABY65_23380 [Enterobacter hormaechei]AKK94730.1 hypothetical protein ABY64_01620 [Enterobacter hormaechei]ANS19246.1 hypothetical protein AB284_22375 [Enterobacter hormaechei]
MIRGLLQRSPDKQDVGIVSLTGCFWFTVIIHRFLFLRKMGRGQWKSGADGRIAKGAAFVWVCMLATK